MGFLDKLGQTLKDTKDTVVEKTKTGADTVRSNSQINEQQRLMNNAYTNIGKRYEEMHSQDFEPEFEEDLRVIANAKAQIEVLQEQIRRNRHRILCANCGAEIPETLLTCTSCGAENPVGRRLEQERQARIAQQQAEREEQARQAQLRAAQARSYAANPYPNGPVPSAPVRTGAAVCAVCGAAITSGAKFCVNCGAQQNPAPAVPVTPVVPAAPVVPTAPAAPAAPKPVENPVVCPACGATVSGNARFCTSCGTKFPQTEEKPAAETPAAETPAAEAAAEAPAAKVNLDKSGDAE